MTDDATRLELYVRSLSPNGAGPSQDAVVASLDRLERAGAIDDYSVRVWGDALPLDSATARTGAGRWISRSVQRFREWVTARDATVPGAFERRETHTLADEGCEVLTLPVLLLAEYRGEELVSVTPRIEDGALYTVADHVGSLGDGPSVEPGETVEVSL